MAYCSSDQNNALLLEKLFHFHQINCWSDYWPVLIFKHLESYAKPCHYWCRNQNSHNMSFFQHDKPCRCANVYPSIAKWVRVTVSVKQSVKLQH